MHFVAMEHNLERNIHSLAQQHDWTDELESVYRISLADSFFAAAGYCKICDRKIGDAGFHSWVEHVASSSHMVAALQKLHILGKEVFLRDYGDMPLLNPQKLQKEHDRQFIAEMATLWVQREKQKGSVAAVTGQAKAPPAPVRLCQFGATCYRRNNPMHAARYAHPEKGTYTKKLCRQGDQCPQLNDQNHLRLFMHKKPDPTNTAASQGRLPTAPAYNKPNQQPNQQPNQHTLTGPNSWSSGLGTRTVASTYDAYNNLYSTTGPVQHPGPVPHPTAGPVLLQNPVLHQNQQQKHYSTSTVSDLSQHRTLYNPAQEINTLRDAGMPGIPATSVARVPGYPPVASSALQGVSPANVVSMLARAAARTGNAPASAGFSGTPSSAAGVPRMSATLAGGHPGLPTSAATVPDRYRKPAESDLLNTAPWMHHDHPSSVQNMQHDEQTHAGKYHPSSTQDTSSWRSPTKRPHQEHGEARREDAMRPRLDDSMRPPVVDTRNEPNQIMLPDDYYDDISSSLTHESPQKHAPAKDYDRGRNSSNDLGRSEHRNDYRSDQRSRDRDSHRSTSRSSNEHQDRRGSHQGSRNDFDSSRYSTNKPRDERDRREQDERDKREKERERRDKEHQERKGREDKQLREREALERRDQEIRQQKDRERREMDSKVRRERDELARKEREAKTQREKEEREKERIQRETEEREKKAKELKERVEKLRKDKEEKLKKDKEEIIRKEKERIQKEKEEWERKEKEVKERVEKLRKEQEEKLKREVKARRDQLEKERKDREQAENLRKEKEQAEKLRKENEEKARKDKLCKEREDREKKDKEEREKKQKEEKESKEKVAKDQKAKQEKDRKVREDPSKKPASGKASLFPKELTSQAEAPAAPAILSGNYRDKMGMKDWQKTELQRVLPAGKSSTDFYWLLVDNLYILVTNFMKTEGYTADQLLAAMSGQDSERVMQLQQMTQSDVTAAARLIYVLRGMDENVVQSLGTLDPSMLQTMVAADPRLQTKGFSMKKIFSSLGWGQPEASGKEEEGAKSAHSSRSHDRDERRSNERHPRDKFPQDRDERDKRDSRSAGSGSKPGSDRDSSGRYAHGRDRHSNAGHDRQGNSEHDRQGYNGRQQNSNSRGNHSTRGGNHSNQGGNHSNRGGNHSNRGPQGYDREQSDRPAVKQGDVPAAQQNVDLDRFGRPLKPVTSYNRR